MLPPQETVLFCVRDDCILPTDSCQPLRGANLRKYKYCSTLRSRSDVVKHRTTCIHFLCMLASFQMRFDDMINLR